MHRIGLFKITTILSLVFFIMVQACKEDTPGEAVMVSADEHMKIASLLRVSRDNPRYFTDDSGNAIYLTGSHTWSNLKDMGNTDPPKPFDFDAYLDFLERHNHNFIRLWTWELATYRYSGAPAGEISYAAPFPWQRIGPGTALDGKPKFDLSTWNEEYFERLRSRVRKAGTKGVYVSVMLFEGHGLQVSEPPLCWDGHPFNSKNNINGIDGDMNGDGRGIEMYTHDAAADIRELQKEYVRKIIDTLNDLDNVLYEIANEPGRESREWQYEMINYIKQYELGKRKQHLVGMTAYLKPFNKDLFKSPADWISPGWETWGKDPYQLNPPAADGSKIVIADTDHLWGMGGNREWVWKSFTRGLHSIYMDDTEKAVLRDAMGKEWKADDARNAMGYTHIFAERMNLNAMAPRNDLASTTYCLANPGHEYLIYQPKSDFMNNIIPPAIKVNVEIGDYVCEWFNPATGRLSKGETFTSRGGQRAFRQPFRGDAVLYIYKS